VTPNQPSSKFIIINILLTSEKKTEDLKAHLLEIGVPATAKWKEVDAKLREANDTVFIATEPYEQIQ
jgi:hypothetical protein